MSLFEDAMAVAVQLPFHERQRLAKALGLALAEPKNSLNLSVGNAPDRSKADPQGWRKSERGHAVLDTSSVASNLVGPDALRGLWAHLDLETGPLDDEIEGADELGSLPPGSPVVLHTSVVEALALDAVATRAFWQNPGVEIRLATATYLKLLEMCENRAQIGRVRAFVQEYAVLSLGPMASSRAAQLMLDEGALHGLTALDALIAATAIAHEIPLVTRSPRPFAGIVGLQVVALP